MGDCRSCKVTVGKVALRVTRPEEYKKLKQAEEAAEKAKAGLGGLLGGDLIPCSRSQSPPRRRARMAHSPPRRTRPPCATRPRLCRPRLMPLWSKPSRAR